MIDGQQIALGTLKPGHLDTTGYTPVFPGDIVTLSFLLAFMAGLKPKDPARVATTAPVDLETGGLLEIDGEQLEEGDRVIVWQQTDPIENGVYVAAAGAWVRAEDFDDVGSNEVIAGTFLIARAGATHAGKAFYVDNATGSSDVVVDIDELIFKVIDAGGTATPVTFKPWVGDAGSGGVFYPVGSTVQEGGEFYISLVAHVSGAGFLADTANWYKLGSGSGGGGLLAAFQADTAYAANAFIRHEGTIWYANAEFTSGATFSAANWTKAIDLNAIKYLAPGITNETGLKAIVTVGLAVGVHIVYRNDSGLLRVWKLRAGTDTETTKIKRPNDYAASTNEKVWEMAEAGTNSYTANFFVSELDDTDEIMFEGAINSLAIVKSTVITTVGYEVRLTAGVYAAAADLAAVQTWITANVSSATVWWLRVSGNAEGGIILKYSR